MSTAYVNVDIETRDLELKLPECELCPEVEKNVASMALSLWIEMAGVGKSIEWEVCAGCHAEHAPILLALDRAALAISSDSRAQSELGAVLKAWVGE